MFSKLNVRKVFNKSDTHKQQHKDFVGQLTLIMTPGFASGSISILATNIVTELQ